MKKTILLILTAAFLMSFPALAEAPVITANPNYYDEINDSFNIYGTIENEIGNVPMTLVITFENKTVYTESTTAKASDDKVTYSFKPMKLLPTTKSGTYTITVRSAFSDNLFSDTYTYYGSDYFLPILKSINSTIETKNQSILFQTITTNASELIIDNTAIENLKPDNKAYFASLLFSENYELPENVTSSEESKMVKDALLKFRSDVKKALSMAEFFNINSKESSEKWFNSYREYYGYTEASTLFKYLSVISENKFISRIKLFNAKDTNEFKAILEKYILLSNIELKNGTTVSNIFLDYPSYFNGFSTAYNNLSVSNKAAVSNYLAGKHYESCEAAVTAANEYAKKYDIDGTEKNSAWGGASGGYNVGGTKVPEEIKNEGKTDEFFDLPKNHWAYNSIMSLYNKKAITGYTDNTFMPDKTITRAEFIKILSVLHGISPENIGSDFSDVSAEHWAYGYIKAARNAGLVTGDNMNSFYPDKPITREDILVILKRAENTPDGTANFADNDDISEYALGAVGYFYEKGIVNGMGANMFMPKNNATRAETCKILNQLYK